MVKDFIEILKGIMALGEKYKDKKVGALCLELQSKIFEFKNEMEAVKDENKTLKQDIERMRNPSLNESDITHTNFGFFILKNDPICIPYCGGCWSQDKRQVLLSKYQSFQYRCPSCKAEFIYDIKEIAYMLDGIDTNEWLKEQFSKETENPNKDIISWGEPCN